MISMSLRPVDPDRDFATLAEWFTFLEGEVNTRESLHTWYIKNQERILSKVANLPHCPLAGFYWITSDRNDPKIASLELYVIPGQRRQGIGSQLMSDVINTLSKTPIKCLHTSLYDDCPHCLSFALQNRFIEKSHSISMLLDLLSWDDTPYTALITDLESQGFLFTSMAELGNTEEAQRKLFALNDMTSSEIPGSEGEHSWNSFKDFQRSVCQSDWYKPAGQKVVIDAKSGDFIGMSAITVFSGSDHAYNLHTGVDKRYRGRKLGQAVKATALCFARDELKATKVRTHHNAVNAPMIAIDQKLGYRIVPGYYRLEKTLP